MKKQAVLRSLIGIVAGISIGYLISIVISLIWGQGYYTPCEPQVIETMGSEINAVLVQTLLYAVLGLTFGAASLVWETEWPLAGQTAFYFLVTAAVMMPTAYFLRWMEHSVWGFLGYFGIYASIFILIWLSQYAAIRRNIKKMNTKLR